MKLVLCEIGFISAWTPVRPVLGPAFGKTNAAILGAPQRAGTLRLNTDSADVRDAAEMTIEVTLNGAIDVAAGGGGPR
jgi:hypothetical protein